MKIAIIDKEEGLKVGGITIYTQRLSAYLTKLGHTVSVLRFSKSKIITKGIYSIPYYYAEPRTYIFLPTLDSLSTIRAYLEKIKPQIVYTPIGLSPLDFFLPALCNELHIPLTGVWHADFNTHTKSYQFLIKSVFLLYLPVCKKLQMLHVFSSQLKRFYIQYGVIEKNIFVLPNGVDANIYSPGLSRFGKINNIKQGVLFLGRLTLQKNPEILIKSFLSLDPALGTKLVIIGTGDLEQKLRHKYQDPRIIFTGIIINEKEKIDIIRACQLFVLPSYAEGMSLSLLEAMATGLACITSDAGGNEEVLGETGVIIPNARLKHKLAPTIHQLLTHPRKSQLLGKQARLRMIKQFDQDTIFARLTDRFRVVVENYSY